MDTRFLLLNVLLFLSEEPVLYEADPYLRKPRMEGNHLRPGLTRARFVGECQARVPRTTEPRARAADKELSGIRRAATGCVDARARIAHGQGRKRRRLTSIRPYRTGKGQDETLW